MKMGRGSNKAHRFYYQWLCCNVAVKHLFQFDRRLVLNTVHYIKSSSSYSRSRLLHRECCLAVKRQTYSGYEKNVVCFQREKCTAAKDKCQLHYFIMFTLMKQRRMYFSNCFLDSFPTNAVTGMAANFYTNHYVINRTARTDINNTLISHIIKTNDR